MGLEVKLTITNNDDGNIQMDVESAGKFKRKAGWEDLSAFSGKEVNSDLLKDWIYNYQEQNFPEALEKPNHRPFKCFIFDEPKKGFTLFKDYDWNPIKLELKVGMAEIKKKCTKQVTLIEPFTWDEMESKLAENNGMEIVSTIKKSKLAGHELGVAMMKSASEITTEFNGFESEGFFMTPTKKTADEVEEETGADVWKSVKTLGDLLEGKPLPEEKEAGFRHQVIANESYVKARIYYKAMFTGEVSTDHKEQYDGRRYWNFPLKYLLQYNDIPKQALIYEDVEFTFYSGVCVADIEPGVMTFTIEDPEGTVHEIQVKPADTADSIKSKVEQVTGIAVSRQVLKNDGNELPGDGTNIEQMGFTDGTALKVEIFKIPSTINCPDEQVLLLHVEPIDTIETLKTMIEAETAIRADKQILKFADALLTDGTVDKNGIKAESVLTLEEDFDPIIFVDIKCNTLFAVDRKEVIEKKALTPIDDNERDFREAMKSKDAREKILKNMNEAPTLGVNPNKVVEKKEVENLGVQEKESIQNTFGVSLKTREQNKKGEELYFVDPKTGDAGELLRKKYIEMNFITPVATAENKEVLEESEKDNARYDKYIGYVRKAFGIEIVPRGV